MVISGLSPKEKDTTHKDIYGLNNNSFIPALEESER